ncbi:hypothetical protein [Trichloromonas sp.]|uniref:hypothetical protein n=1 Tax=Trichloromonas sp. TaxID=3069249 RepID=UPI003D818389
MIKVKSAAGKARRHIGKDLYLLFMGAGRELPYSELPLARFGRLKNVGGLCVKDKLEIRRKYGINKEEIWRVRFSQRLKVLRREGVTVKGFLKMYSPQRQLSGTIAIDSLGHESAGLLNYFRTAYFVHIRTICCCYRPQNTENKIVNSLRGLRENPNQAQTVFHPAADQRGRRFGHVLVHAMEF